MDIYGFKPRKFPVIVICDNDEGAHKVFNAAKNEIMKGLSQEAQCDILTDTQCKFYWICENLYLVKVPSSVGAIESKIENLFSHDLLATKLNGKSFNLSNKLNPELSYGKMVFAKHVVQRNWQNIDFIGFSELINRIQSCIAHYEKMCGEDK